MQRKIQRRAAKVVNHVELHLHVLRRVHETRQLAHASCIVGHVQTVLVLHVEQVLVEAELVHEPAQELEVAVVGSVVHSCSTRAMINNKTSIYFALLKEHSHGKHGTCVYL